MVISSMIYHSSANEDIHTHPQSSYKFQQKENNFVHIKALTIKAAHFVH